MEELCAVMNVDLDDVNDDDKIRAKKLIERHVIKFKLKLKQTLLDQKTRPAYELLYKLMGNEDELKRMGVNNKDMKVEIAKPVIEIKCKEPEVVDKIKNL